MRNFTRAVVAALAFAVGAAAWASDVTGRVVCTGTDVGVENVKVTLTYVGNPTFDYTASDGVWAMHVDWPQRTYDVTLDLTLVGGGVVDMGTLYVPYAVNPTPFVVPAFEVDVPGCAPPPPPPTTADCSPGFYKNHPETWCDACFGGVGCDAIVNQLSARGPEGAMIRDAAKAEIDACFGTAVASPCVDDDS